MAVYGQMKWYHWILVVLGAMAVPLVLALVGEFAFDFIDGVYEVLGPFLILILIMLGVGAVIEIKELEENVQILETENKNLRERRQENGRQGEDKT